MKEKIVCVKKVVLIAIYILLIFFHFFCFLLYIYIYTYTKKIFTKKKNSKSLTSGQGFTVELKRIKQGTKRKRRREGMIMVQNKWKKYSTEA